MRSAKNTTTHRIKTENEESEREKVRLDDMTSQRRGHTARGPAANNLAGLILHRSHVTTRMGGAGALLLALLCLAAADAAPSSSSVMPPRELLRCEDDCYPTYRSLTPRLMQGGSRRDV